MSRAGSPLAIRPATLADLDALAALEEEAFTADRLDRRAIRHAILSPTILALVAETAPGEIAGDALVQIRRGSSVARLTSIAVSGAHGGRGVGRALLAEAERAAAAAGCDRMRLEVRADNDRARQIYGRAGFAAIGAVPDYYEDGEAAHRYEKRVAERAGRGKGRPGS